MEQHESIEIKFIYKVPRVGIYNAIQKVGGRKQDGSIWWLDLDAAVTLVQAGLILFYTWAQGKFAWVDVAQGPSGRYHLRTDADTATTNNLLALPPFPPASDPGWRR